MINNYCFSLKKARILWLFLLIFAGPATGLVYAQADEDCMMCHEDMEEEWPEDRRLVGTFWSEDGDPLWIRASTAFSEEILFTHDAHDSLDCSSCHDDVVAGQRPQGHVKTMAQCVDCHTAAYESWLGSHHDDAMDFATNETVRGDFDDASDTAVVDAAVASRRRSECDDAHGLKGGVAVRLHFLVGLRSKQGRTQQALVKSCHGGVLHRRHQGR